MKQRPEDTAERIVFLATKGLPAHRADWGAAIRAELASIDDVGERRRFARSASLAALWEGYGFRLALAAGSGVVVASAVLTASRMQLPDGGPGLLAVTVPLPAVPLLAVALLAARSARSVRVGIKIGMLALVVSLGAVFSVLAVEGQLWMQRLGVFALDGDPPNHPVGASDVVLDLFITGMWIGHLLFWLPWVVLGSAIGRRLAPAGRAPDLIERERPRRPDWQS